MNAKSPHERKLCGAKTRAGTPCRRLARANGRCNLHGGKSLRGIASATYEGKGFGKDMPKLLLDRFNAAYNDPNMLSLAQEIAALDAFNGAMLAEFEQGGSGALWLALGKTAQKLEAAQRAGQQALRAGDKDAQQRAQDDLADALNEQMGLIKRGASEAERRAELFDNFERRGRLTGEMRKLRKDTMQQVSVEQMLMAFDKIGNVIQMHVTDPVALAAIAAAITRLGHVRPARDAEEDDDE